MRKLDAHTLLSAVWLFILMIMIFPDIHPFVLKSHLEMLLTGYYNVTLITDELLLMGGFFALVPISMVLRPFVLKRRLLWSVSATGAVLSFGLTMLALPIDKDDVLHFTAATCALIAISWTTWAWLKTPSEGQNP